MCVSYRIREWHCSSVIVQINSHTLKLLFNTKTKPFRPSVRHTPDISDKENISLPLVWCCSYSKNPDWTLFNLHIPAVCSWVKTLWTQNTEILIKSLWIIRKRLFVLAVSHTGQIIRHEEMWICSVWIQNHRSWWNTINRCFYSDVQWWLVENFPGKNIPVWLSQYNKRKSIRLCFTKFKIKFEDDSHKTMFSRRCFQNIYIFKHFH